MVICNMFYQKAKDKKHPESKSKTEESSPEFDLDLENEPYPHQDPTDSDSLIPRNLEAWGVVTSAFEKTFGQPDSIDQYYSDGSDQINDDDEIVDSATLANEVEVLSGSYNSFHADSLLVEANELAQQSLGYYDQWRELKTASFELKQEFDEFQKLDKIHEREIKEGYYSLPYRRIKHQRASAWSIHSNQKTVADLLKKIGTEKVTFSNLTDLEYASDELAKIGALPFTKAEWNKPSMTYSWSFRGKSGSGFKSAVMKSITQNVTPIKKWLTWGSLNAQWRSANAAAFSNKERYVGLTQELAWSLNDIKNRKGRTKVARDRMDVRLAESARKNGALNHAEMMNIVRRRFWLRYVKASAMATSASHGLRLLYGIDLPLSGGDGTENRIAKILSAFHDLRRFQRHEQSFAKAIPAKKNSNGKWLVDIEEQFLEHRHVRVTGISAFVRSKELGLWELRIIPPVESIIIHADDNSYTLDQKSTPSVTLGRVTHRESRREPDIVGMSALHNIGPMGNWVIEVVGDESTSGEKMDKIDSIELDIHVVVMNSKALLN